MLLLLVTCTMPQFHVYSTATHEVVAARMIGSREQVTIYGSLLHLMDAKTDENSSYFIRNLIIYIISAVLQFSAANATVNLVTSLTGEEKGFATLLVTYAAGYSSAITPGLLASLGCKKVIIIVNIGYLLFTIGNFQTEYYTLLPAAVLGGYSIAAVWMTSNTYLNALGVSYAKTHNTTESMMISLTNGIAAFCFCSGMLMGNLVSSLLLLPTRDNDITNATEQCSLEPEKFSENQWVYILRSTLTAMCVIALILSVFLDNLREETVAKFTIVKLVTDVKKSIVECGKILLQPNIALAVPWIVGCGMSIAILPGTFARVYVAECLGVHMVGYVFIVYGAASAIAGIAVGKILGYISLTFVSLWNVCLNVGLVSFLLIWEREPNYAVIFFMAFLWGICEGSWITLASSYMALNLKSLRHYVHCIFTLCYMMGYSINYGFGLLLSSQNLLLLVAVYFLVVTPAYLLAEWLSNKRSIAHCLGSPESSHNNDDIVAK